MCEEAWSQPNELQSPDSMQTATDESLLLIDSIPSNPFGKLEL